MRVARRFLFRLGLLAGLGVSLSAVAWAGEGDTFRPLVFANYGHDSNIFRVRDGVGLTPPFSRSDSYTQLGVGFDLDWRPGRQRVRANARVNKTRFNKNSSLLDYDGQDITLTWDWQLGNLWSGQLGHDRERSLGSFLRGDVGFVSNVRTEDSTYFRANYRFHSRWQAGLGLRRYTLDYSDAGQSNSNLESDTTNLGLYYTGREMGRIGVEVRLTDGDYPNRAGGGGLATKFDERFIGGVADWTFSGKTRIRARLGHVKRENTNVAGRDFSGLEWRLDADWTPTGKTLVSASLNREINHTELSTANQQRVTGLELNAMWLALPKTRVGAGLSYENVEYDGSPRTDDVYAVNLNAGYEIWRGGDLTAQIRRETRNSSDPNFDHTSSTSLFLGASLKF